MLLFPFDDANTEQAVLSDDISQKQNMSLFRANKKQMWTFQAVYEKPCAWQYFQLHNNGVNSHVREPADPI